MSDPIADHLYHTGIFNIQLCNVEMRKGKSKGAAYGDKFHGSLFSTCHLMDRLSKTLYIAGGDASDGNPAIFSRVY